VLTPNSSGRRGLPGKGKWLETQRSAPFFFSGSNNLRSEHKRLQNTTSLSRWASKREGKGKTLVNYKYHPLCVKEGNGPLRKATHSWALSPFRFCLSTQGSPGAWTWLFSPLSSLLSLWPWCMFCCGLRSSPPYFHNHSGLWSWLPSSDISTKVCTAHINTGRFALWAEFEFKAWEKATPYFEFHQSCHLNAIQREHHLY